MDETVEATAKSFVLGGDRLDDMPPTFFIGLGGTGGRVVDVLATRLKAEKNWDKHKDLIHFISVDTDRGELAELAKHGQSTSPIAISEKPARIKAIRGLTPGIARNARVAGWVHDWYVFRAATTPGAGQIRLESRFSLYCQLADGQRNNFRSLLSDRLSLALRARNANAGDDAVVRFFIYGSLAGGTGSGANLTVAYLCQRLARMAGIPDVGIQVFGTFFLPSIFRSVVPGPLVNAVNANGYAALKEIEHFMALRYRKKPAEDPVVREEYVHDPAATPGKTVGEEDYVQQPPFSWVYLVDLPEGRTVDPKEIYRTVGEIALLQLFTPILRTQNSAGDNFDQLQMAARDGFFAMQYGSVGAAVVEFPRTALVNYFARRLTIDALNRFVVGRGSDAEADNADALTATEDFRKLSETEQNRLLDEAFLEFIDSEARREKGPPSRAGIFSEIAAMKPTAERDLAAEFSSILKSWYDDFDSKIAIAGVDGPSLSEENPTLDGFHRNLVGDFKVAMATSKAKLAQVERELRDGDSFDKLFNGVSPLMQRYFLVHTNQLGAAIRDRIAADLADDNERARALQWCLLPGPDGANDGLLQLAYAPVDPELYDPDNKEIRKRVQQANAAMRKTLETIGSGRREKAFSEARQAVMNQFNSDVVNNIKDALARHYWREVTALLRKEIGRRLDLFRNTAKAAMGAVTRLETEAKQSQASGVALPPMRESFEGASEGTTAIAGGSFHLGTEVFLDQRAGQRHWNAVFDLAILPSFDLQPNVLAEKISDALAKMLKAQSGGGKAVAGLKVLTEVAVAIDNDLRQRMATFLENGFDLLGGLELEARIVAARQRGDLTAERVNEVPDAAIELYVADKVKYVARMSGPLARLDRGLIPAADLEPFEPHFFGIPKTAKGKGGNLAGTPAPEIVKSAIQRAVAGFEEIKDWNTPDVLTVYQGILGLPLYTWLDVTHELERSYKHESADPERSVPIHTDQRYETTGFHGNTGLGLPNLTVVERQEWEARKAEAERQRRVEVLLPSIVRLMAAEFVIQDGPGYVTAMDGEKSLLGATLTAAIDALAAQMADPDVADAFLESAGAPTEAQYLAVEKSLKSAMAKASVGKRSADVASAKALQAAIPKARAL